MKLHSINKTPRRKPHIRLHYEPTPPRGHPWSAAISRARGAAPHAATPQCAEAWRAIGAALGILAYGA